MQNASNAEEPAVGSDARLQAIMAASNSLLRYLRVYLAPVIVLLCTTGAAFVLWCLWKNWRRLKGKDLILCALTASDFLTVFCSVFANEFMAYGLGGYIKMPHVQFTWVCKLQAYFWILGNSLSSNLLCLLAADRVYALCWPLHHRVHMTKRRYCMAVGALVLAFACVSVHGVVLYDAFEYYGDSYCYLMLSVSKASNMAVQLYTNLVMNGLLSGIALAASNLFLCIRIRRIRLDAAKMTSSSSCSSSGGPSKGEVRASLTLVILAFVYLAASVPRAATFFWQFLLQSGFFNSSASPELQPLLFSLACNFNFLFFINCAVNWIIYCARVPMFKQQLCHRCSGCRTCSPASEQQQQASSYKMSEIN